MCKALIRSPLSEYQHLDFTGKGKGKGKGKGMVLDIAPLTGAQ